VSYLKSWALLKGSDLQDFFPGVEALGRWIIDTFHDAINPRIGMSSFRRLALLGGG
jgi:hypothetical protein